MESFSGFPRGRQNAIASPGFLGRDSANFADSGTQSARPAAEPNPCCPRAGEEQDPSALASGKGAQPCFPGSGCGALRTYCRTGASGLTEAGPRPPGLAPRRGVPWAGKRQVCQESVACWIGARPPQQRGPPRSTSSADSSGDRALLAGRAFWARELAAAPGAQKHQGLGQRPLRPHPGSRPVGRGQSRVAACPDSRFRSPPSLSRLRKKEGTQRASWCPGGCAPRRLSGCAASRG